jgi:hypothetical protein
MGAFWPTAAETPAAAACGAKNPKNAVTAHEAAERASEGGAGLAKNRLFK